MCGCIRLCSCSAHAAQTCAQPFTSSCHNPSDLARSCRGLVVGRVLVGLGIGISAVVVPAYLGELSPAALRGRIVELYEVALCIGMLCAVIADFSLADVHNNWRWMVGIPAIPGLIMSGAAPIFCVSILACVHSCQAA